jgi:hypothetical protein
LFIFKQISARRFKLDRYKETVFTCSLVQVPFVVPGFRIVDGVKALSVLLLLLEDGELLESLVVVLRELFMRLILLLLWLRMPADEVCCCCRFCCLREFLTLDEDCLLLQVFCIVVCCNFLPLMNAFDSFNDMLAGAIIFSQNTSCAYF